MKAPVKIRTGPEVNPFPPWSLMKCTQPLMRCTLRSLIVLISRARGRKLSHFNSERKYVHKIGVERRRRKGGGKQKKRKKQASTCQGEPYII